MNYGPVVEAEQTSTHGTGVELSEPRPSVAPPGSTGRALTQNPLVWVAAGAVVTLVSVTGVYVVLRGGEPEPVTPGADDKTLVIAAPSAPAPVASTPRAASDAADIPVVDPNALPVADDEPDAGRKRTPSWRPPRAPARPPPEEQTKPVEPTPLGNPY